MLIKSICLFVHVFRFLCEPAPDIEFVGWSDEDRAAIQSELSLLSAVIGDDYFHGVRIYHLDPDAEFYSCWSSLVCFGKLEYANNPKMRGLIVHEFGHKLFNELGLTWSDLDYSLGYYSLGEYVHVSGTNPKTGKFERTDLGFVSASQPYCQHCTFMDPGGQSYEEDFADMFMAYVMGYFSDDQAGTLRKSFIEKFIKNLFPNPAAPWGGKQTVFLLN